MAKRKICIVTGTRAEYNLLKPIIKAVHKHSDLELCLIVTGMHLLPEFGNTYKEIEKDGFLINDKLEMTLANDTLSSMAKSTGIAVMGFTQIFNRIKPDILYILGDRIEPFAAAISASIMKIPIAHSGGGEKTGGIDNSIRNAITHLAQFHFIRDPNIKDRLIEIGIAEQNIYHIGYAFLDNLKSMKLLSIQKIEKKFNLKLNKPFLLCVFHADTLNLNESLDIAMNLADAIIEMNYQTLIIYPNADAGGKQIIQIFQKCSQSENVRTIENLSQREYFSLMKYASVFIGNSSSGLIEAPYFNLPFINLGNRQKNRRKLANVVDLSGKKEEIIRYTNEILDNSSFRESLTVNISNYSTDIKTGAFVANLFTKIDLNNEIFYK